MRVKEGEEGTSALHKVHKSFHSQTEITELSISTPKAQLHFL